MELMDILHLLVDVASTIFILGLLVGVATNRLEIKVKE